MHPNIRIDVEIVRTNVRAWREHAGTSLRAVIKSNGYGWGFRTLVDAVDDLVDGYYVSDVDEFDIVRELTRKPIATLLDVPERDVRGVLERGGIPTISSGAGLDVADAWARDARSRARVRIAVRSAVGWSGVAIDDVPRFAELVARRRIDVELSSHISDSSLQAQQTGQFEIALATMRAADVRVVASDLASSSPLATGIARYSHGRLGVGMFGARFGSPIDVACAIAVDAPVVERLESSGQHVGYGIDRAPLWGELIVVRCGYGDGFPRVRGAYDGILAVGMQFATVHRSRNPREDVFGLIDASTDLDRLAASAGISVHELVTALGRSFRDLATT